MSKYHSVKTNGYASKKEATRAAELWMLQKSGVLIDLREQVVFELAPSVVIQGRKRPPLRYIADFAYSRDGVEVVEDVKGVLTSVYRIKRHLLKHVHGIDILET